MEPDQLASQKPADLDQHSLFLKSQLTGSTLFSKQGMYRFSMERVNLSEGNVNRKDLVSVFCYQVYKARL